MPRLSLLGLAAALSAAPSPAPAADPVAGLKLPPGFTVTEFAGPALANDIYTLHIDARGRVVVAGRGYARELIDGDGDGRADVARELVSGLKDGPMGVLWEGDTLYLVTDGGLKRYNGVTGAKPVGAAETVVSLRTSGEHDAHAVRRGPDGWLYLLCGNMAGVSRKTVTSPRSPVTDPVAGGLLRISPDGKQVEVVADGFRNPYGFDFAADGEPFTFDSDNERCVGLPWYEPTRFYHVVHGGNYGWLAPQFDQTWRRPPYFADVVPPAATLGRGSPTGVVCYRHTRFPEKYRGGFFLADWTFGKVWFVRLKPKGASFVGEPEVFLAATGENGFAPTGLAVHPTTGELFVSVGGRGTRGAVYRIGYKSDAAPGPGPAPLPARSLEWDPAAGAKLQDAAITGTPPDRLRALTDIRRHHEHFDPAKLRAVIQANLGHEDRLLRQAAARLVPLLPAAERAALGAGLRDLRARATFGLALAATDPAAALDTGLAVLAVEKADAAARLDAVRVLQLALGDLTDRAAVGGVFEGYTLRVRPEPATAARVAVALRHAFPSGSRELDRELSRTLAAVGDADPRTVTQITARLTDTSDPLDDIHYLIVLARLPTPVPAEQLDRVAGALLELDRKVTRAGHTRDTNWPLRIGEAAQALVRKSPGLAAALVRSPRFGRPDHVLFARLDGMDRAEAARRFVKAGAADPDFGWTPGVVELLAALPDAEVRPLVPKLWDRGDLTDALVPLLARRPTEADRDKFVLGLRSVNAATVARSAEALARLPAARGEPELVPAVQALRRLGDGKPEAPAREAVAALLRGRTGQRLGPSAKEWEAWLARERPDLAKQLAPAGFDASAWRKRAAGIAWDKGDPATGRRVFAKAQCAACHDGSRAVGPPLAGVTKRFGRDDLLTAILDPSRDVSPRYRPVRVTTDDGRAFNGIVIYEAVDGVILQTGPDATVRIAGDRIESRRTLTTSLMPAGLLDPLTDAEVADLFAYLKTLTDKPGTQ